MESSEPAVPNWAGQNWFRNGNKVKLSLYFQSNKPKIVLGFPVSERSRNQTLI